MQDLPQRADAQPAYIVADVKAPWSTDPHRVPVDMLSAITRKVVEIEGPVHQDEVARRVTTSFGKLRTWSLISEASTASLVHLKKSSVLIEQDSFWMTPLQAADPPVRDRSEAAPTLQKAEMLSAVEIRAAAKLEARDNGSLSRAEMVTAITRLLGFRRTGADLKAAIEAGLEDS